MSKTLLSVALLTGAALALPAVEVVQVRQIEKRQDSSADLSAQFPTDINLSDLASLLPTDVPIPTDIAIPTDLDLSSILDGIATLLPSGCQIPSAFASVPTPPADVQSAILSYTDVCHEPSFTGSLGAHYTSYLSEAEAWASSNGPAFSSWASEFATACPYASGIATDEAGLSSLLGSYSVTIPSCTGASATGAKQTGSNSAKQTGSATTGAASGTAGSKESGSSSATQGNNNTGAAPQQTAFAAVAGVVAGFAGVVAYL
ncbi:hypothetical protein DPSP01_010762 [Paraphaeosphaeria sporulosa]|uniref:Infection structure specific protein n=1 Tax=Paraphaeosphaeria sporulosa TaxID=1460663 RepID=A0A177CWF0_9PLEO|nr:uncharacterized protein CC84DRAFT_1159064 [Paraphaeosphaeria sporulosa]OAG11556.1 hypothetical protein CC84DRAFT_1159064 [Paraphaeosphaeria sporulosa]